MRSVILEMNVPNIKIYTTIRNLGIAIEKGENLFTTNIYFWVQNDTKIKIAQLNKNLNNMHIGHSFTVT